MRGSHITSIVVLVGALAACGGDTAETATSTTAAPAPAASPASTMPAQTAAAPPTSVGHVEGPLEFVDDRGERITFDTAPRRVVAWEAMVPALVELGIEPVGVLAFNDIATNPAFREAGVDTATLVPVSTEYGEVDLEVLAQLDPDLILTYTFGGEFLQGFTDANTEELAGQVAPFVALDATADVMTGIERMEALAELLGADLSSDANQAAAATFDEAVADLEALIESKPGLTAAFGGGFAASGLFIAPIDAYPELRFYEGLGLDVFDGPQDSVISWELVEGVDADVFLIDDRTTPAELAELEGIATWNVIPAIAAGQSSTTWRFLVSYSRADYARTIERMLPALEAADPDVI